MNEQTQPKRPDDLVETVTGIMKSATDPGSEEKLVELTKQVMAEDVRNYGVKDHEDLTIEVPLVFYARSVLGGGDGKLMLASVGGEFSVMDMATKQAFSKSRLYMNWQKAENKAKFLETEVERLEKALAETSYYDHDEVEDEGDQ